MTMAPNYENNVLRRPLNFRPSDFFLRYEHGLGELLRRLPQDHERYLELLSYQQQLTENISLARQYGDTPDRNARRAEIITYLNELTLKELGIKFSADLCGPKPEHNTFAPPIYEGLIMLIGWVQQSPEVRDVVIAFRSDFQIVRDQNAILHCYKELHDLFQKLEDEFEQIRQILSRLPSDQWAWDDLQVHESNTADIIEDLLHMAKQAPDAARGSLWVSWITHAKHALRDATHRNDLGPLQHAIKNLERVLNQQPAYINDRLVTSAKGIDLPALIQKMKTIRERLLHSGHEHFANHRIADIEKGIDALQELVDVLKILIATHNELQEIHDELRWIEGFADQSFEELLKELDIFWPHLSELLQKTCLQRRFEGVSKLESLYNDMHRHVEARDPLKVKLSLRLCRSHVINSFTKVDTNLLNRCKESLTASEPLEYLLRIIEDE